MSDLGDDGPALVESIGRAAQAADGCPPFYDQAIVDVRAGRARVVGDGTPSPCCAPPMTAPPRSSSPCTPTIAARASAPSSCSA